MLNVTKSMAMLFDQLAGPLVVIAIRVDLEQSILEMDSGSFVMELLVYFILQTGPNYPYFAIMIHQMDSAIQLGLLQMDFRDHRHYLVVAIAIDFAPNWLIDC